MDNNISRRGILTKIIASIKVNFIFQISQFYHIKIQEAMESPAFPNLRYKDKIEKV